MERDNVCKFNFSRSSDLICLNFVKEKNNNQSKKRRADCNSVHLVTNGKGVLFKNDKSYEINCGDLFFVCEGDEFSVNSNSGSDADGGLEYFYISFHGRRADEFILRFGLDRGSGIFGNHDALIPFWSEAQELACSDNIDLVCESVLLYSIARLKPSKNEKNDVISRMVEITQKNFTDRELSISAIANDLGYDAKYLSSLFKKKRGVAYTQYLREQRIKHAIFLMEQGVVSVKNVAILSGFSDALYFSKIFTASVGVSPKAYIQKISGERETETEA